MSLLQPSPIFHANDSRNLRGLARTPRLARPQHVDCTCNDIMTPATRLQGCGGGPRPATAIPLWIQQKIYTVCCQFCSTRQRTSSWYSHRVCLGLLGAVATYLSLPLGLVSARPDQAHNSFFLQLASMLCIVRQMETALSTGDHSGPGVSSDAQVKRGRAWTKSKPGVDAPRIDAHTCPFV